MKLSSEHESVTTSNGTFNCACVYGTLPLLVWARTGRAWYHIHISTDVRGLGIFPSVFYLCVFCACKMWIYVITSNKITIYINLRQQRYEIPVTCNSLGLVNLITSLSGTTEQILKHILYIVYIQYISTYTVQVHARIITSTKACRKYSLLKTLITITIHIILSQTDSGNFILSKMNDRAFIYCLLL